MAWPLILPLGSSGGSHVATTAVPFPLSGLTSKFSGGPEGARKSGEYKSMVRQWWKEEPQDKNQKRHRGNRLRKLLLKPCKNSENGCARRLQLRRVWLPYIVGTLPLRSCMGLQMEDWAASQAVNTDAPLNHSAGAAMTGYKSCNHDRAVAKTGVEYQMGVKGNEYDEVWYEEIRRERGKKLLTDKVCETGFFSARMYFLSN